MIHTIIGIDPGKQGGIAIISSEGVTVSPYSDERLLEIAAEYQDNNSVLAMIEHVHAMPHQGVSSMFTFGKGVGYIDGVLSANNIKKMFVSPQSWKYYHKLIGTDKQASIERAHELYPDISLRKSSRCRTDSDGMAESLLIANYGYKTLATPQGNTALS